MKWKNVFVMAGAALFLLLLLLLCWNTAAAKVDAAWVEETLDRSAEYSQYPILHYLLDFYVDDGGSSFLPWNWGENWSASLYTMLHSVVNIIWTIVLLLSYFAGWIVEQAFQLDFISSAIDLIAENIQKIAGVSSGGFRSHGLLPSLSLILIVVMGAYFVWVGMLQRKINQALSQLAAFALVFVLGMGVIAYSGSYLHLINDFQQEFNQEMLNIGASVTFGEEDGDMVQGIRRNLYWVMIKTPYLLLQYGTADVDAIGEERITSLLEQAPLSEEREEIVKSEVVELGNENMGFQQVVSRVGMVFLVLVVDLVIGACILFLSGIAVIAQILFILYMYFFPVAWVFSMFPKSSGLLKQILDKCLETLLMRPGITLILTVVFSISTMCYRLSESGSFFWMAFLQIVIYLAAVWKTRELLGFMKIGDSGAVQKTASLGNALINGFLLRNLVKQHSGKGEGNGADDGSKMQRNPGGGESRSEKVRDFYRGTKEWWRNRDFSSENIQHSDVAYTDRAKEIEGKRQPLLEVHDQRRNDCRRTAVHPPAGDPGNEKMLPEGQTVSERRREQIGTRSVLQKEQKIQEKEGGLSRGQMMSEKRQDHVLYADKKEDVRSSQISKENRENPVRSVQEELKKVCLQKEGEIEQRQERQPKRTNHPPIRQQKVNYQDTLIVERDMEQQREQRIKRTSSSLNQPVKNDRQGFEKDPDDIDGYGSQRRINRIQKEKHHDVEMHKNDQKINRRNL